MQLHFDASEIHGYEPTLSPRYPNMRLIRQAKLNDWDELIGRVATEIRELTFGTNRVDT